jgi:hypothetical protein
VVFLTLAATVFAEGVYFLARTGVTRALGWGSDPFQPSVIPFNVGALACGYLAGMALVQPWRSRRTRAAVRIGSDNAYGIYLAQMLFITALASLGWNRFAGLAPFWVWLPLTLAIAYLGSVALAAVLAPWSASSRRAGWRSPSIPALRPPTWRPALGAWCCCAPGRLPWLVIHVHF